MKKQFLILSNMYPSIKTPTQGVFVKNIEMSLINSGIDVEKVVLAGRHDNYAVKAFFYFKYIIAAFFRLLFTKRVIYLHYVAHSSIPLLIASLFRTFDIVAHVHGGDVLPADYEPEWVRKIKLRISRRALSKARIIIVPSTYFKRLLITTFGICEQAIKVNPSGGVDTKRFTPDNTEKDPSFLEDNQLILGYVGRLDSGKGIETLLNALNKLTRNFHCHFVGAGIRKDDFLIMTEELGLSGKVTFHGAVRQHELPTFYRMFDYLVFPSEMQESLGLVGLESMACGTPVVSTINAGMADYMVDGKNGFGFTSGDAESLLSCLHESFSVTLAEYRSLCKEARTTALAFDAVLSNDNLLDILNL